MCSEIVGKLLFLMSEAHLALDVSEYIFCSDVYQTDHLLDNVRIDNIF